MNVGQDLAAVMSDLPKRNGWTIARHGGDRTQRLLNRAAWDTDGGDERGAPVRGGRPEDARVH